MTTHTDTPVVTAAFTDNPRTQAILDGSVKPAQTNLAVSRVGPGDLFYRQLKFAEFDVSELSMASFAIALDRGNDTWIGLPVFSTREFFHTGVIVRDDSSLHRPSELRGKRIGVLEYQQTSVVWIRGIFEHEFGVHARDMEWFMERRPENSHGGSTGFAPPDGVKLTYVAADSSLAAMLTAGEIDAILFYPQFGDAIDRKPGGDRANMRARTLFADPEAEAQRFAAKSAIMPINHGVVVRRSLLREQPQIAHDVYAALIEARDASGERDAFPYGFKTNGHTLETLLTYLHEQGLTSRRIELSELFVDPTGTWEI